MARPKLTPQERLDRLNQAVRDQWKKYDEAVGTVPLVALMQIDRKLFRLEEERNALRDEIEYSSS